MQRVHQKITMNSFLWLLPLIGISEGLNVSSELLPGHQIRHKRNDETPTILEVKYHRQSQVETVVLKKVSDSTLVGLFTNLYFFDDDGEFSEGQDLYEDPSHVPTFYHGVNSFSAVSYFPRTRTLHGTIDQQIYIDNLPLSSASDPDLVDTFSHPIPDADKYSMNTRNRRAMGTKRKSSGGIKWSPRKKFKGTDQKKILYPEIFLIVDVSSQRIDPTLPNQFEGAIMYVLAYWNAVDMLFRNLKRIDVKINIAGILIGKKQDLGEIGWVHRNHIRLDDRDLFILKNHALAKFGQYFYEVEMSERSSYDFLIWMTSGTLVNSDAWHRESEHLRSTKKDYMEAALPPADCGGSHDAEARSQQILNSAIVMYDDNYAQYHTAARGLAHLMFVSDDDFVVSDDFHHSNCLPSNPIIQSSGIMDPTNKRVGDYLLWSYCSEIHFERYSRSKSSCCLLNYPSRTMSVPDFPIFVTVKTQCECHGMRASKIRNYGGNFCDKPLYCKDDGDKRRNIGKPLDGTPCVLAGVGHRNLCSSGECL